MSKHTPGPWTVCSADMIWGGDLRLCPWPLAKMQAGCEPGDAALIAAAPDLLTALEELLLVYFGDGESYSYSTARASIDRAHAAISKARGDAP